MQVPGLQGLRCQLTLPDNREFEKTKLVRKTIGIRRKRLREDLSQYETAIL
jgi:hypothetical protein